MLFLSSPQLLGFSRYAPQHPRPLTRQSTSVLAAVTAISRVLLSFFPIGTFAMWKIMHGVRYVSSDAIKPKPSPEAEAFWKMWCEGEKGSRLSHKDATVFIDTRIDENGGLVAKDGRVAYSFPFPPGKFGIRDTRLDPAKLATSSGRRSGIQQLRHTRFVLNPLPPASLPFYSALPATQRAEVDALRRYSVCLKKFKDSARSASWVVGLLFGLPTFLLAAVYLCGLERTPLTGRWRIILLTPEEEDAISTSLSGANWYRSVINLLTTTDGPAPPILPIEDWRWLWVQDILRRLEAAALEDSRSTRPNGPRQVTGSSAPVPTAQYPLKPRPRMSWMLHSMLPSGNDKVEWEKLEMGPPYSLLLMEKDDRNAFSYGFGGKGASGIVVFSGLLDSILRGGSTAEKTAEVAQSTSFSGLFAGIFGPSTRHTQSTQPTEEQTLHLACVLAHEVGHLLLSHHVETLSQQQVLWPSVLGLTMDLIRAFIWPFTCA